MSVETINPRKKEVSKGYLKAVVGATKRQVENKRVEEEVAAGSVEDDLVKALNVRQITHLCDMKPTKLPSRTWLRQIQLRHSPSTTARLTLCCYPIGRTI